MAILFYMVSVLYGIGIFYAYGEKAEKAYF